MKILKYWYIIEHGEYMAAHGIVGGHERLSDGMKIHTSQIENVSMQGDGTVLIKTKNSEYHCSLPDALFHEFDVSGRKLLPEFDILRDTYERKLEVPGQGDGALFVFDSEAEYSFVGAAFRVGEQRKEFRRAPVHLGMFQDSVPMDWFDKVSGKHIRYAYFPYPGRIEFYDWTMMKTYIRNVGRKKIKVVISGKEYFMEPGRQISILPIWAEDEQGGENDAGEVK